MPAADSYPSSARPFRNFLCDHFRAARQLWRDTERHTSFDIFDNYRIPAQANTVVRVRKVLASTHLVHQGTSAA